MVVQHPLGHVLILSHVSTSPGAPSPWLICGSQTLQESSQLYHSFIWNTLRNSASPAFYSAAACSQPPPAPLPPQAGVGAQSPQLAASHTPRLRSALCIWLVTSGVTKGDGNTGTPAGTLSPLPPLRALPQQQGTELTQGRGHDQGRAQERSAWTWGGHGQALGSWAETPPHQVPAWPVGWGPGQRGAQPWGWGSRTVGFLLLRGLFLKLVILWFCVASQLNYMLGGTNAFFCFF